MAAAAANYKRILQLLEKWPLDKNKAGGRDLGEYLKNYINTAYKENKFETNFKYWDKQYLSIQKLVNNEHKNKYKRLLSSSATGLTAEQCNIILSNELLKELEEEERSVFRKLFSLKPDKDEKKFSSAADECVMEKLPHISVMADETLSYLQPENDQVILDMTFGAGGHSRKILGIAPNVKVLALDRDPKAFDYAKELAKEYPTQVIPLLGCFSELPSLLKSKNIKQNSVDGVLFDFGCSSMQFDEGDRGFSVSKNGPLDMRMDGDRCPGTPTAADVLANATEEDLAKIIKYYGEEKQAKKIARAVIDARYLFKKLTTTEELADLVESVCTEDYRLDKLQRKTHVATKTFQALRIFVNNELNEINYGLILAHHYLKIGGRMITITFHSLEDTIVKRHLSGNLIENAANPLPLKFSSHAGVDENLVEGVIDHKWKMLHKHVLMPKYEEIENNPRSRSAKLRAAIKVR